MLFITDTFDVSMVHPENIANLRFEELTQNQVKKMSRGVTNVTVGVEDRGLLGTYNGLSGTLNRPQGLGPIKMNELDVVILLHKRVYTGAPTDNKFFKVTCRRDFEIFDIDGTAVILDRDGEVHGCAESVTSVPELIDKRDMLNGES